MTPYGNRDLGQHLAQVMACCLTAPSHYLNQCWLIISDIHIREISQELPQPSITKSCLKITCTCVKFHSNFPGANELTGQYMYHGCWCPVDASCQPISYHVIDSTGKWINVLHWTLTATVPALSQGREMIQNTKLWQYIVGLNHCSLGDLYQISASNFQAYFTNWWLWYLLWHCP